MSHTTLSGAHSHLITTKVFGEARVIVFEFPDQSPVTAFVVGDVRAVAAPLVRVHSRCLYGELLYSLECDCRGQLELSFQMIHHEQTGIFVYLEQEGRGCGLINKAKAYILQATEGLDTVDAYRRLGLALDPRGYSSAAEALKYLGAYRVRLLTNNPKKVNGLVESGLDVEQVHLRVKPTPQNYDYLLAKQNQLGHDLALPSRDKVQSSHLSSDCQCVCSI